MWKDIPWYEGLYAVSDCNEWVRNLYLPSKRILKNKLNSKWYVQLWLSKSKQKKNHLLSRLVAITFISNPNNYPIVMHLDNNPLNNHIDNLIWGTQKHNLEQASRENRFPHREVIQYDLNNNCIEKYSSISIASRQTWIINIWKCCQWIRKKAWWFKWKYCNTCTFR